MLTLYHCNTSYASQKVRLYLAEMNVTYRSKHIDLRKQEHITTQYRRINPLGLVPALVEVVDKQQKIICGSTQIIEYVEEHYVDSEFQVQTDLKPHILDFCKQYEALHDPHIRTIGYARVYMSAEKSKEETDRLLLIAEQHSNKARGAFLRRVILKRLSAVEIERAESAIRAALGAMNELLIQNQPSRFIFGEQYSMADAVAIASLFMFKKVGMQGDVANHSAVDRYYHFMEKLPSIPRGELQ